MKWQLEPVSCIPKAYHKYSGLAYKIDHLKINKSTNQIFGWIIFQLKFIGVVVTSKKEDYYCTSNYLCLILAIIKRGHTINW